MVNSIYPDRTVLEVIGISVFITDRLKGGCPLLSCLFVCLI